MKIVDPSETPEGFESNAPERTAQILRWRGITKLDLPVDAVLDAAKSTGLRCVVVMGYETDGSEYFAASIADGADCLWLAERLKMRLLVQS